MSSQPQIRDLAFEPPHADGAAELAGHLASLNRSLAAAVARFRQARAPERRDGLGGVAIFDDEVDEFLATPADALSPTAPVRRSKRGLHAVARADDQRPLATLRRRFDLGDAEIDALVHALAVELDPGYGRVFGYLNNDLGRQRPSVALVIDILADDLPERLAMRQALGPRSALFRFDLLVPRAAADHFTADLCVDASVLAMLLGDAPPATTATPARLDGLLVSAQEREAIDRIVHFLRERPADDAEPVVVMVSGAPGAGRRTCARAICRALGERLRIAAPHATAPVPRLLRDARLAGEVPGLSTAATDPTASLPALLDDLHAAGAPLAFVFIDAEAAPRTPGRAGTTTLRLHLAPPSRDLRIRAWSRALEAHGLIAPEPVLAQVAGIYPFNVGGIHAAARDAALQSRVDGSAGRPLDAPALAQACRDRVDHRLEQLAERLPCRHAWNDLVLPADELARLKEIVGAVQRRDHVMDEWGFGRKVSGGRGVNAIFFGPSGTGKTMAASIIAAELGMAIFRADLSKVVSKYIGETERNLDSLFEEARRSYAVLFFDEAEALFGKRSEVKDAHDRYANIEVAYLLQRMERFEGVVILATNLRKHLDDAFLRRLQFAVEFSLPAVSERLRIWRAVWPAEVELDADVDLAFMASHLELSGGHIRNMAMTSAYLASEEAGRIGMRHLVAAMRREMQKLGRPSAPEQFGRYAHLLAEAAR